MASDTEWKVRPHGALIEIDDNLMTVTGTIEMPLMPLTRRMTVARLGDGRLVVYSAIALDEIGMARLEAWGRPTYLIVPNDHHRLDAAAWGRATRRSASSRQKARARRSPRRCRCRRRIPASTTRRCASSSSPAPGPTRQRWS